MLEAHWEHYEKLPIMHTCETARVHMWKMHQWRNYHSKTVWFQTWTASMTMFLGREYAERLWPVPEMWTAAVLHAYVPAEWKCKLIHTTEHTHMLTMKTESLTTPIPYFYHICILETGLTLNIWSSMIFYLASQCQEPSAELCLCALPSALRLINTDT